MAWNDPLRHLKPNRSGVIWNRISPLKIQNYPRFPAKTPAAALPYRRRYPFHHWAGQFARAHRARHPRPFELTPKASLAALHSFQNVATNATTAHRRQSPSPTTVVVDRPAERDHRSVIPQSSRPALQTFPASHSAGPHDQSRCLSTRRRASNPSAKRMFH